MILIILGSQKFQFNRLLKAMDKQVAEGKIKEPVFAQTGASDYVPINFPSVKFLNRDQLASRVQNADIIITHGGTGSIVGALKQGKKVIAVPRLARYGEHVDGHQLQLLEQFEQQGLICVCKECNELWKAVETVKHTEYKTYESNTARIIESIEEVLSSL